ncbi:lipoprotein, putative [Rhodobacteraceae bacterium KLH11]|nr:lipoprotein, putative [Rhodobacteraceae bacterium KLH11]
MTRVLAFLFLAACSGGSPYFRDQPATRVAVNGSVFDVRVRDELAEAVRVNPQYAPRLGPIRDRAAMAMAQVSGCPLLDVLGDAAVTVGVLGCDRELGEKLIFGALLRGPYECVDYGYYQDYGYQVFECTPY